MARPLTDAEKSTLADGHPSWQVDGEQVSRTFELIDFAEAIGFVNRVALAAEKADHHPDIDIRWNKVMLTLTTHSVSALTDRDAALVGQIDSWERRG